MWRQPLGPRRQTAPDESLIRPFHRQRNDPVPYVAWALAVAFLGWEYEVVNAPVTGSRLVARKLLAQRRQQIDLAYPRVGLRRPHPQAAASQIDVAPANRERLADPQAGERERREGCGPRVRSSRTCRPRSSSPARPTCFVTRGSLPANSARRVWGSPQPRPSATSSRRWIPARDPPTPSRWLGQHGGPPVDLAT
jgi:hypothetical protein